MYYTKYNSNLFFHIWLLWMTLCYCTIFSAWPNFLFLCLTNYRSFSSEGHKPRTYDHLMPSSRKPFTVSAVAESDKSIYAKDGNNPGKVIILYMMAWHHPSLSCFSRLLLSLDVSKIKIKSSWKKGLQKDFCQWWHVSGYRHSSVHANSNYPFVDMLLWNFHHSFMIFLTYHWYKDCICLVWGFWPCQIIVDTWYENSRKLCWFLIGRHMQPNYK